MKKTLVALAALAATASFAQVTLSGRASMDISSWQATGATAGPAADMANRVRVADTSSRITFAANEDLGGGARAGVYCETGINVDTANNNGQANTANANTNTFCSREGRAYYGQGNYEVRLGRQNVWWTQGGLNDVGSNKLGSDALTNLINGGVGVLGVRLENMAKIAVTGGAFAGSEVYRGIQAGANGEAAGANATPHGTYTGFKLAYTTGPWLFMIDQQSSRDSLATAAAAAVNGVNSFDRDAYKYGVAYNYTPTSKVSLQMWNKKRTDLTTPQGAYVQTTAVNTTQAGTGKDSGWGITVMHDLGGGLGLNAQWARANPIKDVNGAEVVDTGATAQTLGLTKALSKRTHLYTAYHKINNEAQGIYGMGGGNYQSGAPAAGADTKMFSLGMIHNF